MDSHTQSHYTVLGRSTPKKSVIKSPNRMQEFRWFWKLRYGSSPRINADWSWTVSFVFYLFLSFLSLFFCVHSLQVSTTRAKSRFAFIQVLKFNISTGPTARRGVTGMTNDGGKQVLKAERWLWECRRPDEQLGKVTFCRKCIAGDTTTGLL